MRNSQGWWTAVLILVWIGTTQPVREALASFPAVTLDIETTVALGPGEAASIAGVTALHTAGCTFGQTGRTPPARST